MIHFGTIIAKSKTMKSILSIVFVLFAQFVIAQKDSFGFRGGVNWTNVKTDTPFDGSETITGIIGGISYQHQFKSGLYLGVDALYAERGFENDLFPGQVDPCFNCLRIAFPVDNKYNFNYFSFPVKAGYTFGDQFMFFADLALVPSALDRTHTSAPEFDEVLERVDRFDLATQIEAGIAFKLFESWTGFSSLGILRSLTSITNDQYFSGNELLHKGINLSFGVRYEFKRS